VSSRKSKPAAIKSVLPTTSFSVVDDELPWPEVAIGAL